MATVNVDAGWVDVDVDLGDFDTDDLIEELERRGKDMSSTRVDFDEDDATIGFSFEQLQFLKDVLSAQNVKVGSIEWFAVEKILKA